MKEKIHPKYEDCKVTCGCGEIFMTRATQAEINVEICSKCHPFFTGKQKLVDTAGRVEKFQRRYAKFQAQGAAAAEAPPPPRLRPTRRRAAERPPRPSNRRSGEADFRRAPQRPTGPPPRRTESAISADPLGTPSR